MAAFGAQSRFSFLYQTLKFKPTDTQFEDSRHGQEVSFESVKEINPDILFVINRIPLPSAGTTQQRRRPRKCPHR